MHNTVLQHKEFAHTVRIPKSINELLHSGGQRLGALRARASARSTVLEHVRKALPPELAASVVGAGIADGELKVSVGSAAWAARLRYVTDSLRREVGSSMNQDIARVRIRVAPQRGRTPDSGP